MSVVPVLPLKNLATIQDIGRWKGQPGKSVICDYGRAASFAFLAEGLALGRLQEFLLNGVDIHIRCNFAIPVKGDGVFAAELVPFESLFGIAIVMAARTITDVNGNEVTKQLRDTLWGKAMTARGETGYGKRRSLISRDPDYPVPECLRGGDRGFPTLETFRPAIRGVARRLGTNPQNQYSVVEEEAITFVHECAHNSYEHGRVGLDRRALAGIRGILLEKVVFQPTELPHQRKDLTPAVKEYIERIWDDMAPSRLITAYTVADLGPGIHNTLPLLDGETAWQRLNRAFLTSASRKPKGSDMKVGQGLLKVVESARRLRAFLFVRSAELLGFLDFSTSKPNSADLQLTEWPERVNLGKVGSAVSLVWPELPARGQGTQQNLLF